MCKVVAAIVDALFVLMMMYVDVFDTSRNAQRKENENSRVLSLVLGSRFVRLNVGNHRMIEHSSSV
jgi:hypothetical protein